MEDSEPEPEFSEDMAEERARARKITASEIERSRDETKRESVQAEKQVNL